MSQAIRRSRHRSLYALFAELAVQPYRSVQLLLNPMLSATTLPLDEIPRRPPMPDSRKKVLM